jgi:uroporphyrinogen III methyltransferase/synthase
VGAGPGDPGLITVAGLERIRDADVIVYDRLISLRLLDHARDGVELIDVGKTPYTGRVLNPTGQLLPSPRGRGAGGEGHDQSAINQCLIDQAREGKRVVRLQGGDPFVFGRGGEEAEALRAAGIDFEVIPGVTSAIAVPAYAGIPVTHRGVAQSFAVITAHEAEDAALLPPTSYLSALAADTLVYLMGVKTLPETVRRLAEAGRSTDTPVAVIRWGTTPKQQTVTGTLADIVDRVREAGLTSPAVTIVGDVVRLRDTISWFESKPLFGKRVLITRTRKQASTLAKLLAAEGAIPIELPSIEIEPNADPAAVDAAAARLAAGDYRWTIFTSANAVEEWFLHLADRNLDARAFGGTRVAAIGPATAQALASRGIAPDLIPPEYVAESILEAIRPHLNSVNSQLSSVISPGVLLPRAEDARPGLPDGLRALGVEVDEVTLYRAGVPTDASAEALEMLRNGEIDIVTFTASSTVRNLVAMLNGSIEALTGESPLSREVGEGPGVRARPLIACIGPITAQTARELGLRVDVEATEHTVEGLVAAVLEYRAVAT